MATVSPRTLKKIELFRGLTDAQLGDIGKLSTEYTCNAGDLCLNLGEKVDSVQIVLKGRVGVESRIPDAPAGRKDIILATLGPGEIYSWSGIFGRVPTASVRAIEATKTLHVYAQKLMELCERDNHIGYVIMKNLALILSTRLKRHRLAILSAVTGFGEGW
jgi:CRP-like cAMP-binding protein